MLLVKRQQRIRAFIVVAALILVGIVLYSGLRYLESTVFYKEQPEPVRQSTRTITRDGVDYYPRQDITTLLFMGIDEYGPAQDSMSYNNPGESDVVLLVVFDEAEKDYNILALNRDTMVEMPILGLGGKRAGTKVAQLALSHTYGSGLQDSCENVKETLSMLLGDSFVDYYISMNMDAIAILNDAVGGVTVTVEEDFSDINSDITKGILTLRGEQALDYVRVRKNLGDQKNITRMKRQEEYVNGFLTALSGKSDGNTDFLLTVYEQLAPYLVTDCSFNTFSALMERYQGFTLGDTMTPEGENIIVNGFYEFHLDEAKMDALILELFYRPKN